MHVVAYVSGHGFGHATREVEILRRLPERIGLTIKSLAPEWFWQREIARPFTFVVDAFDVGCVQTTSLDVDPAATLRAFRERDALNRARFDAEADDLRRMGASVVVTDVASFPLTLAKTVGVPGVCIANFTWADIYAEYVADEPGFAPVVAQLEDEYGQAALCLQTDLSLPMPYFPQREAVGLVARTGADRRDTLLAHLPEAALGKRLALIYAGNWGLPLPWERLNDFAKWHFLSLGAPVNASSQSLPPNFTVAAQDWMAHPDLVASVDCVISKLGYGLTGECLRAGTPLVFCPRAGFAEHAALEAAVLKAGVGVPIALEDFLRALWGDALDHVPPRHAFPPRDAPGGARCAQIIASLA